MTDELNQLSLQLFGKDLRLLTEAEMEALREEASRLSQNIWLMAAEHNTV